MRSVRQYEEVAELPPGFQAQVDMGEAWLPDIYHHRVKIYLFAMVMSHSREKFATIQDHKFTAEEFVTAHDLAFQFFGGRTEEIVYDQDRVMTVSENAGDLLLTETFESYRSYAGFQIRLCRGRDPESKGKIESVVGYLKHNFLACRKFTNISTMNSDLLIWLDRVGNGKVHETTKQIPNRVFIEERKHLKAVPKLSKPPEPHIVTIRKTNVVSYKQNRYQMPRGTYYPGRMARIEADPLRKRVAFYDAATDELLAEHNLSHAKGRLISLPRPAEAAHKCERLQTQALAAFSDVPGAAEFIAKLVERYPRYLREQLRILMKCQADYGKAEINNALVYCLQRELFSANDFRDTLEYFRKSEPEPALTPIALPVKYRVVQAQTRSVSAYMTAFPGGDTR
jgi:hypothetical protein